MKLLKGTRIRIIGYGHKVRTLEKSGKINEVDLAPGLIGREGVIVETGVGYIVRLDNANHNLGWLEEEQVEKITRSYIEIGTSDGKPDSEIVVKKLYLDTPEFEDFMERHKDKGLEFEIKDE